MMNLATVDGLPDVDATFLVQLAACATMLLGMAWLALGVWRKLFPPKVPAYHELATKKELASLRAEMRADLDEMKRRSTERAEKTDERMTQILVEIGKIQTAMTAQQEFSRHSFEEMHETVKAVSKAAHRRIDEISNLGKNA